MSSNLILKNLIYFISVSSNLVLGFFVLSKGRKEKINRNFFGAVLFACGWLISLFLFYFIKNPYWVLWLGRFNFAIGLPIFYFLLKFVVVFPRETIVVPKKVDTFLAVWIFVFAILALFTPLVGKEEIITGLGQRETVYGPLFPVYVFNYVVFSIIIIALLFYKFKRAKAKTEKNQIRYIILGLSLALSLTFITNILLYSFGMSEIANFGPLGTVIFSGFVTAAIFKHHLFNIKVIAVEFFTGLLLFVLLISIFISPTRTQQVLNATIFLGALIFGFFLIKSVIQEIKIREESQKLTKDLQIAYKELKKLDVAKSEFIAMASHQLRTPLSIVKGYVSMLIEGSYGEAPQRFNKPLKNIFNSNERLVKIINDLLNISKIELGKMELSKEKAQLEDLIDSVVNELMPEAENKGIGLKWEKPETHLPKIEVDSLKINQVIACVVDNAIKYTKKGKVVIKTEKLKSKIRIIISDTGAGMSKDEKDKIFESFTRGAAGINLWVQGVGLGLYLSKKYVELHKGRIWAESAGRGKGSVFYIELPIKG